MGVSRFSGEPGGDHGERDDHEQDARIGQQLPDRPLGLRTRLTGAHEESQQRPRGEPSEMGVVVDHPSSEGDVENDPEKEIMAIRFSDTELFLNPISWAEVQKVLKKDGVNSQLLAPTRVSKIVFETLYRMGTQPG